MNNDIFQISMDLRKHFSLFYAIGKMLSIDEDENAPFIAALHYYPEIKEFTMVIKPSEWKKLTMEQKKFVIAHECVHFILEHIQRKQKYMDQKLFNYAADIITNHSLVTKFGFDRKMCDPENKFIWTENTLKEKYDDTQTMESYYEKLSKNESVKSDNNLNKHLVNDHSNQTMSDDEYKEMFKTIIKEMDKGDLETLKNFVDKKAGNHVGGTLGKIIFEKLNIKKPFESVIRDWAKNKMISEPRRFDDFWIPPAKLALLPKSMFLPSQIRKDEKDKHNNVFFFADASGSCSSYVKRFLSIAKELPEKFFTVRMFYFDTNVAEVKDFKQKASTNIRAWGGTKFQIIEKEIQDILKKEQLEYPDAVFVFTDGHNFDGMVKCEKPQQWYWFLTPYNSSRAIPRESHTFSLKDFI